MSSVAGSVYRHGREWERRVCEITFGHEVVCLNNPVKVRALDSDGDSHNHVLRSFSEASVNAEETGAFGSFETEGEG